MPKKQIVVAVVEDEISHVEALRSKLQRAGFSVITAYDGEKGLDLCLRNHPDIIILDILMPYKNGLEVAQTIRENQWGKNVPIIILSNTEDTTEAQVKSIKNSYHFLLKSDTSMKNVVEKVRELTENP